MEASEKKTLRLLLAHLRHAMWQEALPEEAINAGEEDTAALLAEAERHSLLPLTVYSMEKAGLAYPATTAKGRPTAGAQMTAVLQCGMQLRVLALLSDLLEGAEIPFLPLKGSVLRSYYPQPWMRTSCDIDVLIHPEDLERAHELLLSHGFAFSAHCNHDRSYQKDKVHLELHFTTMEEGQAAKSDRVLERIWDYAHPVPGKDYQQALTPEMFYFYHLAHLSKHFLIGGCGIRPLLDLKVMQNTLPCNREQLAQLLQEAGLDRFADIIFRLTELWFGKGEEDRELDAFASYILAGGVYGSMRNYWAMHMAESPNRCRYFLSRLFMPREQMAINYPIVERYPILLPFLWIHRLFRILLTGRRRERMTRELQTLGQMDDTSQADTASLLQTSGLELSE